MTFLYVFSKAYVVWVFLSSVQMYQIVSNFLGLAERGELTFWPCARTKSFCTSLDGESSQPVAGSGPTMTYRDGEACRAPLPCAGGSWQHQNTRASSWVCLSSSSPPVLQAGLPTTRFVGLLDPPPVQTQGFLSPRGRSCAKLRMRSFTFLIS